MTGSVKGSMISIIVSILFGILVISSTIYIVYHFNKRLDRIEEKFAMVNEAQRLIRIVIENQEKNGQGSGLGSFLDPSKLADAAKKLNPVNQAAEAAQKTIGTATQGIGNLTGSGGQTQQATS